MTPFNGTQLVQPWLEEFETLASGEKSLVVQAFDHGLADNVKAILHSVRGRLGDKWEWTWSSLRAALFGIEGENYTW